LAGHLLSKGGLSAMSDRWPKEFERTFDIWERFGLGNGAGKFRDRICGRGGRDSGCSKGRQLVESVADGGKLLLSNEAAPRSWLILDGLGLRS